MPDIDIESLLHHPLFASGAAIALLPMLCLVRYAFTGRWFGRDTGDGAESGGWDDGGDCGSE